MFKLPHSFAHFTLLLFSCQVVSDCLQPHGLQHARLPCPSLSPGVAQTHVHWVDVAIQPFHPLLPLLLLPSVFPSFRVFSSESALHNRWPKCWSFSFRISLSNEHSGLISFRINWFDLAVRGTLKSLFQFHSISSSALSLLYGPTLPSILDSWKNHSFDYMDLCRQNDLIFKVLIIWIQWSNCIYYFSPTWTLI